MPLLTTLSEEDLKYPDPYIGEVYGNALDFYDNPTYNIKLYLVSSSAIADIQRKLTDGTFDSLNLIPADQQVILAQTGVTGITIDNLELQGLTSVDGGAKQNLASFTIREPGGATFLDQIQYAKGALGYGEEGKTTQATWFLEIRFQGYTNNIEDNAEAGEAAVIAGPIVYDIQPTNLELALDETGSTYTFEAIIENTYSFSDTKFKIKQNIITVGKTITDHADVLQKTIQAWHDKANPQAVVKDEFVIDVSQVINANGDQSSLEIIQDEEVAKDQELKESVIRLAKPDSVDDGSVAEDSEDPQTAQANPNRPEKKAEDLVIPHNNGDSIEKILQVIFAACPEYLFKTCRYEDIEELNGPQRKTQANVAALKVVSKSYNLGYDKGRNVYARKYVYIPILYLTPNPNLDEPNSRATEVDEKRERVKQLKANGQLFKAYNYIFTGANDQIIDLDIRYNYNISQMLPPKAGAVGDPAIANKSLAPTAPQDEDLGLLGGVKKLLDDAKGLTDFAKGLDLFDKLTDLKQDAQDAFIGQVEGLLGEGTSDAIRAAVGDRDAAASLLEGLVGSELASIASGQILSGNAEVTTESPTTNLPGGGAYTPDLSPFRYSEDFLTEDELGYTIKSLDDLKELGYNPDTYDQYEIEPSSEAVDDVATRTDNLPIKTGSVATKLHGFMLEKRFENVFFSEINMTIRGDPWYLNSTNPTQKSTPTQSNYKASANCFWLRVGAPLRYDLDWRDEDLNSGYQPGDGFSRAFSSVYILNSVVNRFVGGVFTTDIKGIKSIDLTEPLDDALIDLQNSIREERQQAERDAQTQAAAQQQTQNSPLVEPDDNLSPSLPPDTDNNDPITGGGIA